MIWRYHPIVAAVRDMDGVRAAAALRPPLPVAVFLLGGDIQSLPGYIEMLRSEGKEAFVHMDLVEGVGKDLSGARFLASIGAKGMISTRAPLVRAGHEAGLTTIQRMFLLDSGSLETGVRLLKDSRADLVEVMPGLVPKAISYLRERISQSVIAGGMVTERESVVTALEAGAVAVSTSCRELWNQR